MNKKKKNIYQKGKRLSSLLCVFVFFIQRWVSTWICWIFDVCMCACVCLCALFSINVLEWLNAFLSHMYGRRARICVQLKHGWIPFAFGQHGIVCASVCMCLCCVLCALVYVYKWLENDDDDSIRAYACFVMCDACICLTLTFVCVYLCVCVCVPQRIYSHSLCLSLFQFDEGNVWYIYIFVYIATCRAKQKSNSVPNKRPNCRQITYYINALFFFFFVVISIAYKRIVRVFGLAVCRAASTLSS